MSDVINIKNLGNRIEADHVLFAMVRLQNDSRTLNLSKSLLERGDSVIIIGLLEDDEKILADYDRAIILKVDNPGNVRAFRLWTHFIYNTLGKVHLIRSNFWWAMDVFMLCLGWFFRWIHGGRLLYDAREIYSDLGETKDHPVKASFFLHMESLFIREADLVYTSGWLDSSYLKQLYQISEPEVLLNVPRYSEPDPNNRLREEFSIPADHTIVAYQGILLPGRGFEKILEAIKELDDVHFCVIGGGPEQEKIQKKAESIGVSKRTHCTGWVPYDELLSWSASVDVGLVLIDDTTQSLRYALPNKLFEHAMCGTPVIVTDLPQMAKVVNENQSGIIISPKYTTQDIILAIDRITQPDMYAKFQEGAKKVASRYNWEEESKKIDVFLERASVK